MKMRDNITKADWEHARKQLDNFADVFADAWSQLRTEKGKKDAILLFKNFLDDKLNNTEFPLASIHDGFLKVHNEYWVEERIRVKFVRSYFSSDKLDACYSCESTVWAEVLTTQLTKFANYKPDESKGHSKAGFWQYFLHELCQRRTDKPIPHWFIKYDADQKDSTTRTHMLALAQISEFLKASTVTNENIASREETYHFLKNMPDKYAKLRELTKSKIKGGEKVKGFKDEKLLDYFVERFNPRWKEGTEPEPITPAGYIFDGHPHAEVVRVFAYAVQQHKAQKSSYRNGNSNPKIMALCTHEAVREMVDHEPNFFIDNYSSVVQSLKDERKAYTGHDLDSISQAPRSDKSIDYNSAQHRYHRKDVDAQDIADWCQEVDIFHPTICCEFFAAGKKQGPYPIKNIASKWGIETGGISGSDVDFIQAVLKSTHEIINRETIKPPPKTKTTKTKEGR